jgi:integrase/recombinase XerD
MNTATVKPFLDRYHPQKSGQCKLSIRITYDRKKRYYGIGIALKPAEFDHAMKSKRRNEAVKAIYNKILSFEAKAIAAIGGLPIFTFDKFEEIYLNNRQAVDSVSDAFQVYIDELKSEGREGTAISYQCAQTSLMKFNENLRFADITSSLLRKYEQWMIEQGNSITTVGIYTRSLRTIFNRQAIDRSLYPFGQGKAKYSIPTGRNIKKALSLKEIGKIFHYNPEPGSSDEMVRDYWIFIYLSNGLNVKDLCLLKRKNIDRNKITYIRAKTARSKRDNSEITISLKPETRAIISKWNQPSLDPDGYIFPHLRKGLTAKEERDAIQNLTHLINKRMKQIARKLDIEKEVTTYVARHSFATVLKNSGKSVEFISEMLGHSDIKTTKNYLASFDDEAIHEQTDVLTTAFAK